MPLFDKYQQEQMTHQPAPEQTDTIKAINQYFKDVGSGKIARENLQDLATMAQRAMQGDPEAATNMVTMFGGAGIVKNIGQKVGRRTIDTMAKGLREPMENLKGFDMSKMNALRAERAAMLEKARAEKTRGMELDRNFAEMVKAQRARIDRNDKIALAAKDVIAVPASVGTASLYVDMLDKLRAHTTKLKNERKLKTEK